MLRECRERFPRHRLQSKPYLAIPACILARASRHVPWCMSGSLTRGGGETVPGIPGACASRSFTYMARGPLWWKMCPWNESLCQKIRSVKIYNDTGIHSSSFHILTFSLCAARSPAGLLNIKLSSYPYRDPMLKIRRSHDRLIFNMRIPIPGKDSLYIETGPRIPLTTWLCLYTNELDGLLWAALMVGLFAWY